MNSKDMTISDYIAFKRDLQRNARKLAMYLAIEESIISERSIKITCFSGLARVGRASKLTFKGCCVDTPEDYYGPIDINGIKSVEHA